VNTLTSIQVEYVVIISTIIVIVIVIFVVILIIIDSIVIIVVIKLQQILTKINTPNNKYQFTAIKEFGASIT
jgi:hypothetical protein